MPFKKKCVHKTVWPLLKPPLRCILMLINMCNTWKTTKFFLTECFPLQIKNQLQNGCSLTYAFTERQNLVCTFPLLSYNGRYGLTKLWVFLEILLKQVWTVYKRAWHSGIIDLPTIPQNQTDLKQMFYKIMF